MKAKRILALLLAAVLLLALCACGGNGNTASNTAAPDTQTAAPTATPEATPEATPDAAADETPADTAPETMEYTDDLGRTMTLPGQITRVVVTGPLAQTIVFAVAPDLMVAVANEWNPGTENYLKQEYLDLPVLGQLYGGKSTLNLEELLATAPQVVLDVGEAKEGTAEDLDKLAEQTGIPFVHINSSSLGAANAFRRLGELLDRAEAGEALASYCEEKNAYFESVMEQVGEGRMSLLYLLGDKGLNVIAKGSYHGEIFDLLGDNAAVLDSPSSKGTGNETDMEQILLWNPDFIIFSFDAVSVDVNDPAWQQLKAIQNGNYATAPYGPYNWMGFPPSVQLYLGMLWMMDTMYPEFADYDLQSEVNRYFDLFYHCTLNDEQYAAIIG